MIVNRGLSSGCFNIYVPVSAEIKYDIMHRVSCHFTFTNVVHETEMAFYAISKLYKKSGNVCTG